MTLLFCFFKLLLSFSFTGAELRLLFTTLNMALCPLTFPKTFHSDISAHEVCFYPSFGGLSVGGSSPGKKQPIGPACTCRLRHAWGLCTST